MMDMVSRIEIADAVANYTRVADRVREVALCVLAIRETAPLPHGEPKEWWMDSFGFDMKEADDSRHGVRVHLSCRYFAPSEDREDGLEDAGARLSRFLDFPIRYLTTDDWEEDEKRAARNDRRRMARIQLSGVADAVEKAKISVTDWETRYAELEKLAGEDDE